jgi:hypothetical protein
MYICVNLYGTWHFSDLFFIILHTLTYHIVFHLFFVALYFPLGFYVRYGMLQCCGCKYLFRIRNPAYGSGQTGYLIV